MQGLHDGGAIDAQNESFVQWPVMMKTCMLTMAVPSLATARATASSPSSCAILCCDMGATIIGMLSLRPAMWHCSHESQLFLHHLS